MLENRKTDIDPLSIVIVNFNAGKSLVDCVASIVASGYPVQIIVVDNGSEDGSIDILTDTFGSLESLLILHNRANLGFAKACNIGARQSSGRYLLFLNPDCVIENDTIPVLVNTLDTHPEAGMVGAMLVNPDGTEQAGGRRAVPTPWRSFVRLSGLHRLKLRYPRLFYDYLLHLENVPEREIEVEATSGACMLMRREVMNAVGCFDENYFLHVEDLDCCMRIRRKGFKVLFVPCARVIHQRGVCGENRPIFVEWHKHRGLARFYRKYFKHQYPGPLMVLVNIGVWCHFLILFSYLNLQRVLKPIQTRNEKICYPPTNRHGKR